MNKIRITKRGLDIYEFSIVWYDAWENRIILAIGYGKREISISRKGFKYLKQ